MRRSFLSILLIVALVTPITARAASAPDAGRAFVPRPLSKELYGTKAPDEDPEVQRHYVEGHDGVDLYVETWLPAEKDGHAPPKKIPTILIMTPYVSQGVEEYPPSGSAPGFIQYMTARGYAVAQHHVRGTGESGGCLEQTSTNQIDDGARVVEYLGKKAPWSNGKVGMYGISYDAETQISTAGFGDRKRLKFLKAIIPAASVGAQYDWNYFDGVPWIAQTFIGNFAYLALVSIIPGQEPAPQHYPEKANCQGEVMAESANADGDYTEYWQKREYRPGAPKVEAATLFVHGLRDFNVQPITAAGFFNRLPKGTPHKGIFGVWNHAFPYAHSSVEPEWARADWFDTVTAWFDKYLKGLPTHVEEWPDVQIQSSDGQWWAAPEYPTTGGLVGQLALSTDGTLGSTKPDGTTAYIEQLHVGESAAGQQAVFETKAVKDPLHVTGQPILDMWVTTNLPDGHLASKIEVVGPDGEVLRHAGGSAEALATYGYRSLMHIEPIEDHTFFQEEGIPPSTEEPLHVQLRYLPTDLIVPKGGSLRLTISGQISYSKGDSQPSGTGSMITILHDCDYPSSLRFLMPDRNADLLNVREIDEKDPHISSKPKEVGMRDGGGLATEKVCGKAPERIPLLRTYY